MGDGQGGKKNVPRPKEVDPDDELVGSLKPSTGPLFRAIVLNGGLALVLLGGPFARGMLRAESSVAAFSRFAACMTGGTPVEGGGLALPEGEREAFALQVQEAGPDWPARCTADLDAIAMEEALFILPGVKDDEADVRAAVTLVRGEVERIERGRDAPVGTLEAMGRLQGALTELTRAASARLSPRDEAITLPPGGTLPASRLPTTVAAGGTTDVRWTEGGLDVVAADSHRVAVVRVRGATVHEEHERRSGASRALAVGPDASAYLLFTTREETCDADELHCARRMTGIAATDGTAVTERVAERWLGGHLAARADRGVAIAGARVWMLARSASGLELRGFDWSVAEDGESGSEGEGESEGESESESDEPADTAPRHRARVRLALAGAHDAVLSEDAVHWISGGTLRSGSLVGAFDAGEVGTPLEAPLAQEAQRLFSCGVFVVAAAREGLEPFVVDGALRSLGPLVLEVRPPLETPSEADDPVQLACTDELLAIAAVRPGPTLDVIACDTASCRVLSTGSSASHSGDVAIADGVLWVAEWGGTGAHQVRVRRARVGPLGGIALEAAPLLPTCWSDGRGFCAPAAFASDGTRLALVARENADALVLAVEDGELTGLPGLR